MSGSAGLGALTLLNGYGASDGLAANTTRDGSMQQATQATVTNNNISTPGNINTGFNGIRLNNGVVATDNFTSCVDIRTNTVAGSGAGATSPNNNDIRFRQRQATTVRLPGYAGANSVNAAVEAFVSGNQTTISTINAFNTVPTGGGFVGGAACVTPP